MLQATKAAVLAAILSGISIISLNAADLPPMVETPMFADQVATGDLPPVSERIPAEPRVVDLSGEGHSLGEPGGELVTLMGRPKDIRIMTVYGYARLICYDEDYEMIPDILASFDAQEGRIFTFTLRKGHKWSDGEPFTTEDFRYYWEDVANNEELSPFGPPTDMIVDGELPTVEIVDEVTIRYSWSKPNPDLLERLSSASPMYLYRPAHYLKQFHPTYQDADKLAAMVEESGQRDWAALHHRRDRQYRFDNVDMPTLQPWVNRTPPPAERFVFERNPYYHRIDSAGHQLPYLNRVLVKIADGKIIPAKAGAGESDLQARDLRFDHYTFLKEGENRHDFTVRLWNTAVGAQIALFPNLNASDEGWRALMRDPRFRHALSLAIDRGEINQVIYYGLATEGNNTVLARSPLYKDEYRTKWAAFDLDRANALLDEIGLTERDDRGVRLMPDGRPLEIIVDTAGESTEETDVLELVHDTWLRAGVKLYTRPSQREVFRNRVFAGEAIMSVWEGITNAAPTAGMNPKALAPVEQIQLQWPMFGQFFETAGAAGTAPDMPEAERLVALNDAWRNADSIEEKRAIWHEMLEIHAEQTFSIGIVSGVPQPVVVHNDLRNVPEQGVYTWDPGAYFGMYKPDTFWFTQAHRDGG